MSHFWKGNIHAHSMASDGDSSPEAVVQWYRSHGYHFLAVTDHHVLTTGLREFSDLESAGVFRVIRGEEVTYDINSIDPLVHFIPVHANALCATRVIPYPHIREGDVRAAVRPTIARVIRDIRATGALAQLNHPNLHDAFSVEDILAALPADRPLLFEVANQHPMVNNAGTDPSGHAYRLSTEQIWDALLEAGREVYGTATDDMHDLGLTVATYGRNGPVDPNGRYGGRGWVQVATELLEPQSLCAALEHGQFYASTGIELDVVRVAATEIRLTIHSAGGATAAEYSTMFIGAGVDRNDAVVVGLNPSYRLHGTEQYVRAVVTGPSGKKAWIQPVFVRRQ